jgi:hypothetical protein
MAEKSLALTGGVINSADTWVLPFVDRSHAWAIGLIFAGFTGTGALVKARAKGEDSTAWRAIPYTSRHLNGAVSDDTSKATALTSSSLIQVTVADGMEVALDLSGGGWTAGTITVTAKPAVT